ncbi:ImmA/IrrE family metallo-endopeptidase [Trinickia sp. EG282A]|uniref:ImmA/IrrE family metallo-endopeptidase n=1 Tax=Trinickia sp. EG282A TaxID=3237013 RepID=UPI0034D2AAFA
MSAINPYSRAEQRLQALGISAPEDIDLEAIAWDEGVRVQYSDLSGCEARLVGVGDRAIVTIRSSTDDRRKRFSLAHELGHWNYHRGRSFECRADDMVEKFSSKPIEEREADSYAADLLMPAYMFQPLVRNVKRPTFDAVSELAEKFNTSITATAIRMVDVNVWPLLLVCHAKGGRLWFKRSRDVPDRWFPQGELDSDSLAFDRLFGEKDRTRAQKIGAEAWFDRRGAERFNIVEDAIRISNGQVLALLWIEDNEMLDDSGRY